MLIALNKWIFELDRIANELDGGNLPLPAALVSQAIDSLNAARESLLASQGATQDFPSYLMPRRSDEPRALP